MALGHTLQNVFEVGQGFVAHREPPQEAVRLDRKIADYLAGLDEADDADPNDRPDAVLSALTALHAGSGRVWQQAGPTAEFF